MKECTPRKKTDRGFPRRSASAKVKVTCQKKGLLGAVPDRTTIALDLSQAGARLLVSVPLEVGEEVVLTLEAPSCQKALTRHGKVVWALRVTKGRYAVGVRFEDHLDCAEMQQLTVQPVRLDY